MRTSIIAAILACTTATAAASRHHIATQLDVVAPGHALLTVVVSTNQSEPNPVVTAIAIPFGMTPTAMTLERKEMEPMTADRLRVDDARDDFDEIVRRIRDPALLEYIRARRARLTVFPVRRGDPAKIVIALTATSLVQAQSLPTLDEDHSLIAHEPFVGADPVYEPGADYWPEHPEAGARD